MRTSSKTKTTRLSKPNYKTPSKIKGFETPLEEKLLMDIRLQLCRDEIIDRFIRNLFAELSEA